MSDSFKSTFISAFVTHFCAVECRVRPVLTHLRKPILATRWIANLLTVTQMGRDWSVDMNLWSIYFIVETVNVE